MAGRYRVLPARGPLPRPRPPEPPTVRPDIVVPLIWSLPVLEIGCGCLQPFIGWWALVLAALFVVALIGAVTWSTGGER